MLETLEASNKAWLSQGSDWVQTRWVWSLVFGGNLCSDLETWRKSALRCLWTSSDVNSQWHKDTGEKAAESDSHIQWERGQWNFGNTKTPACLFFQKSGWRNYSECGFGQNCEMHQLHNGTFQAQLLTHSHFCHKRLILIPSRIMGPKISSSQGEKESLSPCVDLCLTDILER